MDDGASNEPIFRASKRRKVFRKRDASDEDTPPESREQAATISNHPTEIDDNDAAAPVRVQVKKPSSRKHGIGFTSTERRTRDGEEENGETALVLARGEDAQELPAGDRFVRPTGRVAVTEDKHMMAYIDSKLAEARSVTPSAGTANDDAAAALAEPDTEPADRIITTVSDGFGQASTFRAAQTKSTRADNRPTKPRRRGPPVRAEEDIARDSMIDQIMHEAQVPLYAQPTPGSTMAGGGEDNDAATAEAFKAQLLAEMAMHNRRRPAKAAGKDAKPSNGPKLGGSRSQRERMKALEEEAKAGKK